MYPGPLERPTTAPPTTLEPGVMPTELTLPLIGLALLDSTSFGTLLIPLWLMLAPEVVRRVLDAAVAGAPVAAEQEEASSAVEQLTGREREVLAALGRGLSNAQIGTELSITEATAKTHVSRVLAKLGVTSRVQAALIAQRLG